MEPFDVPPGHALVIYTRMPKSSLKTKVRRRFGRRCSIRQYDMTAIDLPGVEIASRPVAYAYAEGALAVELSRTARSGSFTAVIANPWSKRPVIVAIVDHEQATAFARRARMRQEDAAWEAAAPARAESGIMTTQERGNP